MPRVLQNKYEYMVRDKVKALHGRLLAEGVRDTEVARWLGCTSQNVGNHFRNASFTYKQILIIQDHLSMIEGEKQWAAN